MRVANYTRSDHAKELGRKYLDRLNDGGRLVVQVTRTNPQNTTYRYKVFLAYTDDGATHVEPITYWLAAGLGEKVTDNNELKGSGGGFSRYFHAVQNFIYALEKLGIETPPRYVYDVKYSEL
jgi:hypothetical protein